jgi:succinoglycan biosynthesis protein ExoA
VDNDLFRISEFDIRICFGFRVSDSEFGICGETKDPNPVDHPYPYITVMVPVRNEAACIENTLRRLLDQNYDPDRFEVIVADGRSTDDTVPIVRRLQVEYPNLRLLYNPKRLSSAARNLCVKAGRGEYFVLIDGHCEIRSRNYLRYVASAFQRSGADCLGRPQPLEVSGASAVQQAIALARRSPLGHNPGSFIYSSEERFVEASSVAVAYRRNVFDTVGYFDERFDACEDVEFNHRVDEAKLKCFFAPQIAVHYYPRSTVPGLVYQMSRYGRGRLRLAHKHPRSLTAPSLAPMLFIVGMSLCALLGFWFPPFATLFCLGVLAYAGIVAAGALSLLPKPGNLLAKIWLPIVFLSVHVGFAWGSLSEVMRRFMARVSRSHRVAQMPRSRM